MDDLEKKISSNFGERLRKRRKELNLSQEAVGVSIGLDESCSRTRISRYETGVHEPDTRTARKLASVLQIPAVYLYCERNSIAELILVVDKLSDENIDSLTSELAQRKSAQSN